MSVVRKIISLQKDDAEFLENKSISLSKFVQNNIKKLKIETRSASNSERVSSSSHSGEHT